ncbi:LapA family protein [uncultured Litoreibacter sp.]|uniref:LapA family protein n=1 Tax=uncultured Litoreibacter sp. TaxID=1392394 RepID=UPI0026036BAE|nr:LapA family protein [uncultured Litoreibacter sp.]
MRYLRYAFLAAVGFCLLIVALANRGTVSIQLLPDEMAAYLGQPFSFELPLFIIIFGGIVVGLLIGFVWEWFREHKHRADARAQRREKEMLQRQVKGMKAEKAKGQDEVLALLE